MHLLRPTVEGVDRIAIIGCGGSGKSTVARQLARILDVPLVQLDAIYYDEHWTPLPGDDFAAQQEKLVTGERWIIEGNYASTLPIRLAAADTVIFLDLPAAACLWGIAQRRLRYRGGQHQADGVYDRITWNFIRYILDYRHTMRPRVRNLLQEHGPHVRLRTLTSRRQANRFIDRVQREFSRRPTSGVHRVRPRPPRSNGSRAPTDHPRQASGHEKGPDPA
jgi:adenylate kinase family enzyme